MALGGGTFISQNKVLPGSYINVVSAARRNAALSERGIVAMPYTGDWGAENEVVQVTAEMVRKDCLKLFGYAYDHAAMAMFREIFANAKSLYTYRLNTGAVKADCAISTAKCGGKRGNAIAHTVVSSVDAQGSFEVRTLLDGTVVDSQTVSGAAELQDNDFVSFKKDAALEATAGLYLEGGENGTEKSGDAYQKFLDKIESYSFHVLGCNTADETVIALFTAFTKRMREEMGVKIQTVVYRAKNADYEGVISVENKVLNSDANEFDLVYWTAGAAAGCAINESNLNKVYDGEYKIDTDYTQAELEKALRAGKFMFHRVGGDVRVLDDINTLVTYTEDKGEELAGNQTVRVLDQIATEVASLFGGKYLGKIPNDKAGRISLWNDIVKLHIDLQDMRAIENFSAGDITVEPGETKKSVVVSGCVTPVSAMAQMYMTVIAQ